MSHVKVHVRNNGSATLICPACGFIKNIAAERFRQTRHSFSVRCRCQQIFSIQLDFRRHFRKKTNLTGTYLITSEHGIGGGMIQIQNISRGGLGFTVSGLHGIKKGHELELEFELNDRKQSQLKKQAIVRSVNKNTIGCEFVDIGAMEKALGFYLQS